MKILMISPEPFFDTRGTPYSVYQRILALVNLGYNVELLTYPLGRKISIPGVEIHRSPRIPFIQEVRIGPSWKKALLDILLLLKAIQLLVTRSYDVVHAHEEASFFSVFLAAIFSKRHIYDMHSSLPLQLKKSRYGRVWPLVKLFQILERLVINTCDAVITIGPDLDDHVHQVNPTVNSLMIENLALQMNGSNTTLEPFQSLKTNFNVNGYLPIVYTGSLEHYQGLDLLLESAQIVRQTNSHAFFILVGGTSEQVYELREKIKHCQLDDIMVLTGNVPLEDALAYLEIAKVLVSPRTEGMSIPFKVYSYIQSGKPIVATRIDAHTSVLSDETALLVETTPEAFAKGILKILQEPDLANELGLRAQQLSREKYNFTNYVQKVDQIYGTINPVKAQQKMPKIV